MSSVTFSTTVGGDGSTVTDDDNATTGLGNGGALIRLVPMMQQVVDVASYVVSVGGGASDDATAAAASAAAASSSASAAAASYDSFDDRYLGSKTSDPSVDNDGNTLLVGALYWNSSSGVMKVWTGSAWVNPNPAAGYLALTGGTMTGAIDCVVDQTFTGTLPLTGGTMTGAIDFVVGQTFTGTLPLTGGTLTGALEMTDQILSRAMFKDVGYTYYNSSTTNALDYVNGSHQRWTPNTGAQTLSITNWSPTGNLSELLIEGVNLGAATITFPTINWIKADGTTTTTFSSNGVTLQTSGVDWIVLWTRDAGTTIYGKVIR